jgi:hypothetical protein
MGCRLGVKSKLGAWIATLLEQASISLYIQIFNSLSSQSTVLTVTGQPRFAVQKQIRAGIVVTERCPLAAYNGILTVIIINAIL